MSQYYSYITFCLFIKVSGEYTISTAFRNEVLSYSIQTSLFDVVVCILIDNYQALKLHVFTLYFNIYTYIYIFFFHLDFSCCKTLCDYTLLCIYKAVTLVGCCCKYSMFLISLSFMYVCMHMHID